MERFAKENKALKTTLFVVGTVVICLLPLCFCLTVIATGLYNAIICPISQTLVITCAMLNPLLNPLIYCWRQKEMRKVILGESKNPFRDTMKEGNVKKRVNNLITIFLDFALVFSINF